LFLFLFCSNVCSRMDNFWAIAPLSSLPKTGLNIFSTDGS
jgi:hypothetical protein